MSKKDKVMQVYGGSAFRNKKKLWKRHYYTPNKTKDPLLHKPEELSEAQWADLIQFWETDEQQKISRQNKINKDKSEVKQTTGRKSFARIVHEMEVENGVHPSRGSLFEVTHTSKKTSDALDNVSRNYISKMRALAGTDEQGTPLPLTDEHYYQVIPLERHGRQRGHGPRVTPTSSTFVDVEERIQDEAKRRVHDMTNEIESRLKAQMTEQMQTMMKQFHSDMVYHERDVSEKCKLMNWQSIVVAEGRLESKDPNALVHHTPLRPDTWKVWVDVAVDPKLHCGECVGDVHY